MYYVLSITYKSFKICLILTFFVYTIYYILHTTATPAGAQIMSNENYMLQTEDINQASGETASAGSKQLPADPSISEGVNFKAKAGFENPVSAFPFSVSLSSNLVDFGSLTPTNPIIRTLDLSVNNIPPYGYSVLVFENNTLKMTAQAGGEAVIPNTTCDLGACSAENAAEWTNTLTYGFGYRCDNVIGADCESSFASSNFYKHFSDIANNDDPASIMAGVGSNNRQVRISYKVNISGTQSQGVYSNIITYIAVPNY